MSAGTAPKFYPALLKSIQKLRATRSLGPEAFITEKELRKGLSSWNVGTEEIDFSLGKFFKENPEQIKLDDLEKAITLPEVKVTELSKKGALALEERAAELNKSIGRTFDEYQIELDKGDNVSFGKLEEIRERRIALRAEREEVLKGVARPEFNILGREFLEGKNYTEELLTLNKFDFVDEIHWPKIKGLFVDIRRSDLPVPESLGGTPDDILRMIEEMQAEGIKRAIRGKIDPPVAFTKSWPMYAFKQQLAGAAADPNIKYIGWSSGETVRVAEDAGTGAIPVGSKAANYFIQLMDEHLPSNVKKYVKKWGVEPKQIGVGKEINLIVESAPNGRWRVVREDTNTVHGEFSSRAEADNEMVKQIQEIRRKRIGVKTAWVLPITDQMRTDILTKGQPIDLKAITIASGAGAMGAVTTQDIAAADEEEGILRRGLNAYLTQVPLVGIIFDKKQRDILGRGLGIAFGTLNAGYAAIWAAGVANEDLKKSPDWKRTKKDEFLYVAKAMKDSIIASMFKKGSWGTTWADYHKAVVGESPREYYGNVTGTVVDIVVSIVADPLIPLDIVAPVAIAVRAGRAKGLVKEFKKVPGILDTYGDDIIERVAREIAALPKKAREKFANRMQSTKNAANDFVIGLIDTKTKIVKGPVATQGGRPVSDMTIDEYRATMSNPQRGNRETNRFVLKEAGVTEKAYVDPKTRVKAQKKIVEWYKAAFGISDPIDTLSTQKSTQAIAKVGTDNYRINIAFDAKPIDIAEEVMHVKDMTRGYFGTPDISQGHFMNISGDNFAADFVHMRSTKNAISNGDAVRNEVLTDYILQRHDWARVAAGLEPLPRQPVPPGLRYLAKDDEALLEFISSTGDSVPPWIRVSDAERIAAGTKLADDPTKITDIWSRMGSEGVLTDEVVAANIDIIRQFMRVTQNPGNTALQRQYTNSLAAFSRASSETASTHRWMQIALRRQDVIRDEIRIGLGGANFADLERIVDQADPEALGAFFAKHANIFDDKPGIGEGIVEYYVNNLLTSLSAHSTNFLSNLQYGTYNVFFKHPASAFVDFTLHKLTGREQQIYLGEIMKSWAAVPKSARKGAQAAGLVIRRGGKAGTERIGIKYEVRRSWIEARNVPEVVKFMYNGALRFMMAGDVFFRSAVGGSHLEALAFRYAKKTGRSFEDVMKNIPEHLVKESQRIGSRSVYFDDPGPMMASLLNARNRVPAKLGYFAATFMHTLTRIVARGIEMTPVIGAVRALPGKVSVPLRIGDRFRLAKEEVKVFKRLSRLKDMEVTAIEMTNRTKRLDRLAAIAQERKELIESSGRILDAKARVLPETIVDQITGLTIGIPIWHQWQKGNMTGNYPTDPKEKKEWKIQGKTPYSMRVAGGWRRYNDLMGPFGYPMAAWVSLFDTIKRRGEEPMTGEEQERIVESFIQTARDMGSYIKYNTFIRNAMESVDALTGAAGDSMEFGRRMAEKWLGNTAAGFFPYTGLVRQFNRARTAYNVGQTVTRRSEGIFENFAASLGFAAGDIKIDYRGRPAGSIERITEEGGKIQAFAVQMFPFLRARFPKADEVDIAFLMSGYLPGLPNRNINKIRLNDELYRQLQIVRGREINKVIEEFIQRPSWKELDKQYRRGGKSGERAQVRMRNLLERRVGNLTTKVRTRFKRRPDVRVYLEANRGD